MLENVKYERTDGNQSVSTTVTENDFNSVDELKRHFLNEGDTLRRDYCHAKAQNYDGTNSVTENTVITDDDTFNIYVNDVMIMSGSFPV